jgi:hypothetical protein
MEFVMILGLSYKIESFYMSNLYESNLCTACYDCSEIFQENKFCLMVHIYLFFSFFFVLARQALYHLSHTLSAFFFYLFWG